MKCGPVLVVLFCTFLSVFAETPSAPEPTLGNGDKEFHAGHFEAAASIYSSLLETYPDSVGAAVGLTRALLKQEKVDAAEAAISKLLPARADISEVEAAKADVDFRRARLSDAETEYRKALQLDDHNAEAWYGLGRICKLVSLNATAALAFRNAHRLDPEDPDIERAWTLMQQDSSALRNYLEGAEHEDQPGDQHLRSILKAADELKSRKVWQRSSPYEPATLKLEPLRNSPVEPIFGWALVVLINGKPIKLQLDTGASGLLLGGKAAERAGIRKLAQTDFSGVGDEGRVSGYIGLADTVRVGPVEFHNAVVEVSDKQQVVERDGLIGADVFDDFLVEIDMHGGHLRLEPLPDDASVHGPGPHDRYIAPSMKDYTRIVRVGSKIFVPTFVLNGKKTPNPQPELFLLDTGAADNALSLNAAKRVGKPGKEEWYEVRGVSGKVKQLYNLDKVEIQFSRYRQRNLHLFSWDLSPMSREYGMEVSGILGMQIFSQLKFSIDYRDGLVEFSQP